MYKLHKLIRKATVISILLLVVVGTAEVSANYKAESTEHPVCDVIAQDIVDYQKRLDELHFDLIWILLAKSSTYGEIIGLIDNLKRYEDLLHRASIAYGQHKCILFSKLLP